MKKGKKYLEVSKLVEKNKLYTLEEAVELVKKTTVTKFDSSVELAMRLNLDTKKADQQLRGATVLPNGMVEPHFGHIIPEVVSGVFSLTPSPQWGQNLESSLISFPQLLQ